MIDDSLYEEGKAEMVAREAQVSRELMEDEDADPIPLESTPITDEFLSEDLDDDYGDDE